jgi:RNA polymerase sigma-70 factor (ECF subfamily)
MEEFKALFDECADGLRNYVYYKCGDEDLANDIVQDTFLKIWELRQTIDWNSAKGLLYTTANNLTKNHFKHQQVKLKFKSAADTREGHSTTPQFVLEEQEFELRLQGCIGQLPLASREAFLMNRIDSKKYREIAEILEISIKAVEKRMSIAIKFLTECIGFKI